MTDYNNKKIERFFYTQTLFEGSESLHSSNII